MSLIQVARDTLKEIPMSDVIRERLSLAFDQLADAQHQVEVLQTEKGSLNAQLERERTDHEQTKKELKRLEELAREESFFVQDIEFRRGVRTGGIWKPFCPKCHLPVVIPDAHDEYACCSDHNCHWVSRVESRQIKFNVTFPP